ncbi:hypothetical protein B481_0134 [Planococcus halocryophilus Or1]|nr:hypothetical protein B481_0134 [Planococcus halocryophilus Or1]
MIFEKSYKYTFVAEIVGGNLYLDSSIKANSDIIDIAWISIDDYKNFDEITTPLLHLLGNHETAKIL